MNVDGIENARFIVIGVCVTIWLKLTELYVFEPLTIWHVKSTSFWTSCGSSIWAVIAQVILLPIVPIDGHVTSRWNVPVLLLIPSRAAACLS